MFTGIIEKVCELKSVANTSTGRRYVIDIDFLADDAKVGDSIAVNGVCLTVSTITGTVAEFDVMAETLRASTLGSLKVNDKLNLERAMAANSRFGGHFVQGHVDGTGTISKIVRQAGQVLIYITAPDDMVKHLIAKGSVAIDGISLTIVSVDAKTFYVSLIPTTLADTNLAGRKEGDLVNLEADIVAKLINARLDNMVGAGSITEAKLRGLGF